jgi:cell division protein FtsQ
VENLRPMDLFDDPATRRAILKRQSVRRENESVFPKVWKVFHFAISCFLKFSCLVFVLAFFSALFVFLYDNLLRSPYIQLERVVVFGVDETMKNELLEMGELDFEKSLFAINLDEVKERLEKHPWAKSVTVEKQFPHTLAVRVEREEPWAIVASDKLRYMNRSGRIFKEVEDGEPFDFPIVTGVPMTGENVGKPIETAVHVLGVLEAEKGDWSMEHLSELHVRGDGSVYLYYSSLPFGIKLRADELANRMEDLKKVVEHLNRSGRIRTAKGINLEYADGAVVSFKKG